VQRRWTVRVRKPLDRRCPYWGPAEELRTNSQADAIAVSLFQAPQDGGEFFFEIPQQIFAYPLHYGPTPGGACRMDE